MWGERERRAGVSRAEASCPIRPGAGFSSDGSDGGSERLGAVHPFLRGMIQPEFEKEKLNINDREQMKSRKIA